MTTKLIKRLFSAQRWKDRIKKLIHLIYSTTYLPAKNQLQLRSILKKLNQSCDPESKYTQVLNVYKRNSLLLQLERLLSQDTQPARLLIYQNDSHISFGRLFESLKLSNILYTKNHNWNTYYHGRFYNAFLAAETDYIIFWDDDLFPQDSWNSHCLSLSESLNAIITSNGRILSLPDTIELSYPKKGSQYCLEPQYLYPVLNPIEVDYGGHSWCLRKDWLHTMFYHRSPSYTNSEDFHISASCYIELGIKTFMSSQQSSYASTSNQVFIAFENDQHSSFKHLHSQFTTERDRIAGEWVAQGYTPVLLR